MSTQNKHGYEMFLYRIRGYVKNVNKSGSQTIFNIEPSSLHASDMQIGGVTHSAITLIGHRLILVIRKLAVARQMVCTPSLSALQIRTSYPTPSISRTSR